MKTNKRIWSLILSFAIVCGCCTINGVSAEDNSGNSNIERKLNAFGILTEGFFDGNDNITRANYAKLMTEFLNVNCGETADSTRFIDVSADNSSAGSINYLYDMGYISGYDSNSFKPEQNITYNEALKIIVNALGYKYSAERENENNTLAVASDLGLLKSITCNFSESVQKQSILKIIDNALDAEVMGMKYSAGTISFEKSDKTALESYHEIFVRKGIVSQNSYSSLTDGIVMRTDNSIYIDGDKFEFSSKQDNFLGYDVKCYYREDDESYVGVYIEKSNRNEVLDIDGNDIDEISNDKMSYTDGEKTKNIKMSHPKVIYNGVAYTDYGQIENIDFKNSKVTLLSNDGDGTFDIIYITKLADYYVSKVDRKHRIVYDDVNNNSIELPENDCTVLIYNENNEAADINSIAVDKVVSVAQSMNKTGDKLIVVYISDKTVTGDIEEYNEESGWKVNDTFYKVSEQCTQTLKTGQKVKLFLGKEGRIIARNNIFDTDKLAILYKMHEDERDNQKIWVRLYTQEGEFENYYFEKKVKIDDTSLAAKLKILQDTLPQGQVMMFAANGNKITQIRLPKDENAKQGEFKLVSKGEHMPVRGNNGSYILAGKAAVDVKSSVSIFAPTDPAETEAYGMFETKYIDNMRDKKYAIYSTTGDKLVTADYIILYDAAKALLTSSSNVYVVENIFEGLDADDVACNMITLSGNNKISNTYSIAEELDTTTDVGYRPDVPVMTIRGVELSEINKGDIIRIALDSLGKITKIEKVYDYDDPKNEKARLQPGNDVVDSAPYYNEVSGFKDTGAARLVYSKIDAAKGDFVQFETTTFKTMDDWAISANAEYQKELVKIGSESIILYNHDNKTSRIIKQEEIQNYLGNAFVMRAEQNLLQEVIIYE